MATVTPAQSNTLDVTGDSLHLVQVTDTHLCRESGGRLLSLDTDASLREVLRTVKAEQPQIDAILATGDLADNGSEPPYRRLRDYLEAVCKTQFWLPGNHDDVQAMAAVAGADRTVRQVDAGNWQILMLNSQIPGEVGGRLGAAQLQWLQEVLSAQPEKFTLVCLHHQPLSIGSAWIDEQKVLDGEPFLELLAEFPGVRAVLWGHVHQEVDRHWEHIRLLASPSTCVQFKPGSEEFMAERKPPGYRWLTLHADGRLETGVSRVEDVSFHVDVESGGYLEY